MSTFTEEQLKQINYVLKKVLNTNTEVISEHLAENLHYKLEIDPSTLKRALYEPVNFELQTLHSHLFQALKSIKE